MQLYHHCNQFLCIPRQREYPGSSFLVIFFYPTHLIWVFYPLATCNIRCSRKIFFKLGAVYLFGLLLIAFIQARNCCKKIQTWATQQTNGVLGDKEGCAWCLFAFLELLLIILYGFFFLTVTCT
jgi:hypothetical protein